MLKPQADSGSGEILGVLLKKKGGSSEEKSGQLLKLPPDNPTKFDFAEGLLQDCPAVDTVLLFLTNARHYRNVLATHLVNLFLTN